MDENKEESLREEVEIDKEGQIIFSEAQLSALKQEITSIFTKKMQNESIGSKNSDDHVAQLITTAVEIFKTLGEMIYTRYSEM